MSRNLVKRRGPCAKYHTLVSDPLRTPRQLRRRLVYFYTSERLHLRIGKFTRHFYPLPSAIKLPIARNEFDVFLRRDGSLFRDNVIPTPTGVQEPEPGTHECSSQQASNRCSGDSTA